MKVSHMNLCPVCRGELKKDEANPLYHQQPTPGRGLGGYHIFLCITPLVKNPLHYYSHVVASNNPDSIIFQEFSVDLGTKYILFANDYEKEKSLIKNSKDAQELEIPAVLVPDFPDLENLIKKIRMSIVFS